MEKMKVRDLMVSADRFPKISDDATFYEALSTLERAQAQFMSGKAEQRILLVQNAQGKVIAKLSPIDLIRGLETNYSRIDTEQTIKHFGLSYIWKSMQKEYGLWEDPFKDLCRKASEVQIKNFIQPPQEGQTVRPDDTLAKCFHLFVMNRHDSLFVMQEGDIIGLLRFSDVYKRMSETMKACAL